MAKFWELLQESTIAQGTIAVMLTGTCCALWLTGRPVPELLGWAFVGVLGFFFGFKFQQLVSKKKEAE